MKLNLPIFIFFILVTSSKVSRAVDCKNENIMRSTITVGKSGPTGVTIPPEKPCIFLEGSGRHVTIITHDDHDQTDTSATFTSSPDNVVASGITFQNSYNRALALNSYYSSMAIGDPIARAVAARIYGDKSAFFECGFVGFQDTLWDVQGRHFFKNTYIEGGVDFIWGSGQSIYMDCMINVTVGTMLPQGCMGYITAQRRESANEANGFVFRRGSVYGSGQALLGRAYGPYSRVIFHQTTFNNVVAPPGWGAWHYPGQEDKFTFAEVDCRGPGSDTSRRVNWMKKFSPSDLNPYTVSKFINQDGWLNKLPSR
ncbi:putative pectinesterase 52 [Quercus suber]|uniref:pectinesterase n=1 Tax=Quercus suber TaxID=58331 RepID=A0AAW0KZC3_QUESU